MKELVVEYLKDSLNQIEDDLRNGALIGSIVINGYKEKFDYFDFKLLQKTLERSYTHKVAILSLSYIISDKKIRKKFVNLINKFMNDGYSSVRKAAAFSEPGFWGFEKKKNQLKKIKSLIKDLKKRKLSESYIEGVLLGIGINSLDLDPEIFVEILNFYSKVQETYNNESILISLCYGVSIFAVATNQVENSNNVLKNLLNSNIKRVRTSAAESLSFLNGYQTFNNSLDIIETLVLHPAYKESWPIDLAIILSFLNNHDSKSKKMLIEKVRSLNNNELEVSYLLSLIEKHSDPLKVLQDCLSSEYSQLRLASLFSTYFAELHKIKLKKAKKDFEKFAELSTSLLNDSSSTIRSFALYRLLSYSLTLNTDKYIDYFKSHLNDQYYRNRFISSVAITYLTALHNPDSLLDIKNELYGFDLQVRKGVLIGMAMGVNPLIHESESNDELILGLIELSGESTNIGFILTQSSLNNLK